MSKKECKKETSFSHIVPKKTMFVNASETPFLSYEYYVSMC
jgi:hypothetical protein